MIDLDALESLAQAATPGPWTDEHTDRLERHFVFCRNGSKLICESEEWAKESINGQANAAFIAAANPAVVLKLVTELRRQRKAMHRLARALRIKTRALAIAQRECKHAQERAAQKEEKQ